MAETSTYNCRVWSQIKTTLEDDQSGTATRGLYTPSVDSVWLLMRHTTMLHPLVPSVTGGSDAALVVSRSRVAGEWSKGNSSQVVMLCARGGHDSCMDKGKEIEYIWFGRDERSRNPMQYYQKRAAGPSFQMPMYVKGPGNGADYDYVSCLNKL